MDAVEIFRFTPQPGHGQIVFGAFIEADYAGIWPLHSAGDDRGFGIGDTWDHSRLAVIIDFETGTAHVRVARSCLDHAKTDDCTPAGLSGLSFEVIDYTDSRLYSHRHCGDHIGCWVEPDQLGDSQSVIDIRFNQANPAAFVAPSLDMKVQARAVGDGTVELDIHGNVFPSVEAYHIGTGGDVATSVQSHAPIEGWGAMAGTLILPTQGRGYAVHCADPESQVCERLRGD